MSTATDKGTSSRTIVWRRTSAALALLAGLAALGVVICHVVIRPLPYRVVPYGLDEGGRPGIPYWYSKSQILLLGYDGLHLLDVETGRNDRLTLIDKQLGGVATVTAKPVPAPEYDEYPCPSPDGRWILFVANGPNRATDWVLARIDGSALRTIPYPSGDLNVITGIRWNSASTGWTAAFVGNDHRTHISRYTVGSPSAVCDTVANVAASRVGEITDCVGFSPERQGSRHCGQTSVVPGESDRDRLVRSTEPA